MAALETRESRLSAWASLGGVGFVVLFVIGTLLMFSDTPMGDGLNRVLGYDEASAIAKQALASGRSIREVVVERGHLESGTLTEEQLDAALDVLRMTRP